MRRILIALALMAIAGSAQARTLTDQFGRTVTISPDAAAYTVNGSDGFSAIVKPNVAGDDAAALRTINGMAPANTAPTPASPVISKSAFLARFTPAELVAISAGARSNDTLNVWLITAQAADSINLGDAATKQGLDALVAAGILTAARETVILTP